MRYLEEFNCALLFSVHIWKELKYFQKEISFVFFCYYGHSPAQLVVDVEYSEFFE